MYKSIAVILIFAVCMSPVVQGQALATANAGAIASSSQIHRLNPVLIDHYGHQIGLPLLAPHLGALTSLYAAAMPPRSYVGHSNPALICNNVAGRFVGESSLGIVAL